MNPFPEKHDLLALFECEPTLVDPEAEVPWAYNRLTFETQRGADRVVCEIEPGNEMLTVKWSRDEAVLVSLDLQAVSGLQADLERDREALVAYFQDPHILPLRLQLKPSVSVSWSTDTPFV